MDRHLFVQLLSNFHINIFSKKIQLLNYFKNYFVPNKYIFRKYNPFYNILFIFIYFIRYVPISKLFYYFIVLFFHTPFFIPVVLSLYEPNICFLWACASNLCIGAAFSCEEAEFGRDVEVLFVEEFILFIESREVVDWEEVGRLLMEGAEVADSGRGGGKLWVLLVVLE